MGENGGNGIEKADWRKMLKAWTECQVSLDHLRWRQYQTKEYEDKARPQTCLQHQYSIIVLGLNVLNALHPWLSAFDRHLLLTALEVHDLGEGILKRDVLYRDKTVQKDLEEYLAFCEFYGPCWKPFVHYQNAFLLQFCLENPECFPADARDVMAQLAKEKKREALMFTFVEYLDYIYYCLEQYVEHGFGEPLLEVTRADRYDRDVFLKMDEIAKVLPVEGSIWTPEFKEEVRGFCEEIRRKKEEEGLRAMVKAINLGETG